VNTGIDMEAFAKRSRTAALLYFFACLPAPFGLMYVPNKLMVAGDAAATAARIRDSEALLRMGIGAELFCAMLGVVAVLALYRLFEPIHRAFAQAMAALYLVGIPIWMANVVNPIAALQLAKGAKFLSAIDPRQLDALSYFFMRLHSQGLTVAQILWGVWLIPYGMAVIRAGFIPKLTGIALIAAGIGYVIASFFSLFLPRYAGVVNPYALALGIGELPIAVWLVVWGPRVQAEASPSLRVQHAT
jgi:hypothetical protein